VSETHQIYVEPCAMVVDLPDEVLALCELMLPSGGLKVHRLANAAAVCESIGNLLPRLVVVPVTMRAADLDLIDDRAVAVGASILYLDWSHGSEMVTAQLHEMLLDLHEKFGSRRR
jgi:hypothetical protein